MNYFYPIVHKEYMKTKKKPKSKSIKMKTKIEAELINDPLYEELQKAKAEIHTLEGTLQVSKSMADSLKKEMFALDQIAEKQKETINEQTERLSKYQQESNAQSWIFLPSELLLVGAPAPTEMILVRKVRDVSVFDLTFYIASLEVREKAQKAVGEAGRSGDQVKLEKLKQRIIEILKEQK